ncbi:hypothetical protein ACX27_08735 [Nostoc piscinale CENA21]|uniref:Polysaccharide pyruvyl transferase domain-containing protein n=1 Tax=Nostoc piscinale CENA21 TaxID=224013 RepID=A0A0M4SW80_9NOSO|nr:polysaccharide pyruvyl transferase family protein [Nostoc piscinale]ALF52921.1 hypothetical protein ACX27_08735 [Nostoc piscinale CENA21]
MKALVTGCFSLEGGGATAGDLLAAELVCDWLDSVGFPYDIAVIPPFRGGIDFRLADPKNYSHAIFVCGPFGRERRGDDFLNRFSNCQTIGIDLTMLEPLEKWNPFDILIERDSSVCARPDITFLSRRELVPVVGVCLVEPYGAAFEEVAYAAIQRLVASRQISVVEIDTRLDTNSQGFRSPAEIESILARMDMVITTRLHGTVLSLKNGVPTLSIDPGGDSLKIKRQAETIGWPVVFTADKITDEALQQAFDYCLTEEAQLKARECSERAKKMVEEIRNEFIKVLTCSNELACQDTTWTSTKKKL